jgi:hypothetical protein
MKFGGIRRKRRWRKTTLFVNEIRSGAAEVDSWIILALSLAIGAVIGLTGSRDWFAFGVPLIVILGHRSIFNILGIDGSAVVRYLTAPLPGHKVLLAKNRAYACITTVQVLPLFVAAAVYAIRASPVRDAGLSETAIRTSAAGGSAAGVPILLMAASFLIVLTMYCLVGSFFSVLSPRARSSRGSEGGTSSFAAALAVWGVPYLAIRWTGGAGVRLGILFGLFVVSAAAYAFFLPGMGRWMLEQKESIMRKLSA